MSGDRKVHLNPRDVLITIISTLTRNTNDDTY